MVEAGRSIKGRTFTKRKMTDSEKNLIVDLHLAGESQYAIAKELGRTEQVISYHIRKHKGLIASKLRAKAEDVSNACKELSDAISNVLAEAA